EGIHRHFNVGKLDARAVGLHSDFDVLIDCPLDGHEYLHGFKFGPGFSTAAPGRAHSVPMLRCGNVRACVAAVNAGSGAEIKRTERAPPTGGRHRSGREKGNELESPPSTARAWPLT